MTNVKKHTRKGKNKVSVVRKHTRKDGKPRVKGSGEEYTKKQVTSCGTSKCAKSDPKKCGK